MLAKRSETVSAKIRQYPSRLGKRIYELIFKRQIEFFAKPLDKLKIKSVSVVSDKFVSLAIIHKKSDHVFYVRRVFYVVVVNMVDLRRSVGDMPVRIDESIVILRYLSPLEFYRSDLYYIVRLSIRTRSLEIKYNKLIVENIIAMPHYIE